MPSILRSRRSSKSLKFKAPSRKSCATENIRNTKKLEKRVPKVTLRLADNITSTLTKNGNWTTEFDTKDDKSQDLPHLQELHEKLEKDKETLCKRHAFLLDMANSKTEVLMKLEKERKQLLRIVRKNALNCTKSEENGK